MIDRAMHWPRLKMIKRKDGIKDCCVPSFWKHGDSKSWDRFRGGFLSLKVIRLKVLTNELVRRFSNWIVKGCLESAKRVRRAKQASGKELLRLIISFFFLIILKKHFQNSVGSCEFGWFVSFCLRMFLAIKPNLGTIINF